MRKIVFLIFIIIVIVSISIKDENILIPNNAIRIRIIANSNELKDQEIKTRVKNEVNDFLYKKLENIDKYNDAKNVLNNNMKSINKIVSNYVTNFEINYGKNYFPEKEYKGTKYKEGEYESIVIKLGEGKGKNFWCVLFPPLCMIDENKIENNTYSLYVKELLKKIK